MSERFRSRGTEPARLRDHDVIGYLADPTTLQEFTRGGITRIVRPGSKEPRSDEQAKHGNTPAQFNPKRSPLDQLDTTDLPGEVVRDMRADLSRPGDSRISVLMVNGAIRVKERIPKSGPKSSRHR